MSTTTPLTLRWSKTGLNPVQRSPDSPKVKGQNGKSRVASQPLTPTVRKVTEAASGIPKPPASSGEKKKQNAVRTVTRKGKGVLGPYSKTPILIQGGTRRNSKADSAPALTRPPEVYRQPLGLMNAVGLQSGSDSPNLMVPDIYAHQQEEPETKIDERPGLFTAEELVEASIQAVPEHIRAAVRAALNGDPSPSRRNSSASTVGVDFIQDAQPVKQSRRSLSASDLNRAASSADEEFVVRENRYDFPLYKINPTAEQIAGLALPDVDELQLSHTNISDGQLLALLARFPNLKVVVLMHCPNLTPRVLEPLGRLSKLEYLSLHSCKGFTSDQLLSMLSKASWPYIEKLDFCDTSFNNNCLALLENFPSLQTIELSLCVEVTREMIEKVKKKSLVQFVWEDGLLLTTQRELVCQRLDYQEVESPVEETVVAGDTRGGSEEVRYMDLGGDVSFDYEIVEPPAQVVSIQGRLSLKQEKRALFLAEFFAERGVFKNFDSELDRYEREISAYYTSRCGILNRSFPISRETWLDVDLLIQKNEAQENMKRILAAEWDEQERGINWAELGVDRPQTIKDFIALLEGKPRLFGKLKTLNLSNMGLTFFPQVFAQADFHSLEVLDLSGNKLRTLPPNFFCFAPNLKKVLLLKNRLLAVTPDLLEYWHELNWLDLSENSLRFIPPHFLISAEMLKTIFLSNNNLSRESFDDADWEFLNASNRISDWKRNR